MIRVLDFKPRGPKMSAGRKFLHQGMGVRIDGIEKMILIPSISKTRASNLSIGRKSPRACSSEGTLIQHWIWGAGLEIKCYINFLVLTIVLILEL